MRTLSTLVFMLTASAIALGLSVSAGAQQPAPGQKPAAAPQPAAPQSAGSRTLKMQSSFPASSTLQDNFRFFAERVDKLTGGQLKIDALAAGQVVPAFEVLDASSKKVIDGAHSVSYYWVGKNKAATLFAFSK